MTKKLCFLLTLLCGFQSSAFAQADQVKVGIYITNLYDFNLGDGSYVAEFWTWSLHENDNLNFKDTQEVIQSKKTVCTNFASQKKANVNWEQKKCVATILQDWDNRKFPFDQQKLMINLEETMLDSSVVNYVADTANSKVNADLKLENWKINRFTIQATNANYDTTYGDPELQGSSSYPKVQAVIELSRTSSWTTFIKLVTGLYVAFMIALMVFRIKPPDSDSRVELAVGGLFAAVGNKYIVEGIVPTTTQNTMIDNMHNITFGAILLIVVITIYISGQFYEGHKAKALRLDKISFWGILSVYITLNILLVLKAIS
ncbi:MAG: hypothetical protein WBC07_09600 [Methylotenera sp.]